MSYYLKKYCILCHPCLGNIFSSSLLAGQEKYGGITASPGQSADTDGTVLSPQHKRAEAPVCPPSLPSNCHQSQEQVNFSGVYLPEKRTSQTKHQA